jgi:hypothetical protein
MRKKFLLPCVMLAGAVVTGAALSSGTVRSARLAQVSNQGTPVFSLVPSQAQDLRASHVEPQVSLLGVRAGFSFYTGTSASGQPCFLESNSTAPAPEISFVACLGQGDGVFPSANEPIVDFSAYWKTLADPQLHVRWLAGFAADGVAQVGLVDGSGQLTTTPVIGNVYASRDVPNTPITAIVALDSSGRTVWQRQLGA